MAGQIIISNIKTDSDNAFSILANTGAVLFSANLASGITTGIADGSVTNAKLAGSITGDKITVGSLAGNVFTANTITGDKIGQSAISSNNIVSVNASVATVGTLPSARLPAGSVLQVVQTVLQTSTTTTSTSFVTTGLSASITPKFSTSKIWVSIAANGVRTDNTTYNVDLALFRGASQQGNDFTWFGGSGGGAKDGRLGTVCFQLLDSPATTSATTYALYFASESGASTSYICDQNVSVCPSYITLMEIAA